MLVFSTQQAGASRRWLNKSVSWRGDVDDVCRMVCPKFEAQCAPKWGAALLEKKTKDNMKQLQTQGMFYQSYPLEN